MLCRLCLLSGVSSTFGECGIILGHSCFFCWGCPSNLPLACSQMCQDSEGTRVNPDTQRYKTGSDIWGGHTIPFDHWHLKFKASILLLIKQSPTSLAWPSGPPTATFPNSSVPTLPQAPASARMTHHHPWALTYVFLGVRLHSQHLLGLAAPASLSSQLSHQAKSDPPFQAQVKDNQVTPRKINLSWGIQCFFASPLAAPLREGQDQAHTRWAWPRQVGTH